MKQMEKFKLLSQRFEVQMVDWVGKRETGPLRVSDPVTD